MLRRTPAKVDEAHDPDAAGQLAHHKLVGLEVVVGAAVRGELPQHLEPDLCACVLGRLSMTMARRTPRTVFLLTLALLGTARCATRSAAHLCDLAREVEVGA